MTAWIQACFVLAVLVGCGHHGGDATGDGGGGGGDGGATGDGGSTIDAPIFSGMCTPGGAQCSNCIDDDGDGRIDGFDTQCTGPLDNDEATFATGIPGDNKDAVDQDCFFDGNSGSGNDGCSIHVCCLLGAKTVAECPIGANRFDPNQCGMVSQKCIDHCGKLAPPGCDCFGCCKVCDPVSNQCAIVLINPLDSVGCTPETLFDPTKCLTCEQHLECGNPTCGEPGSCILCPGQDPADLPPTCNGMNTCPNGEQSCLMDSNCPEQSYCTSGCCVAVIL
jgi:hypothetical protein